ncbi:MAG: hypothetical protein GX149_05460 [Acholeplasmataceae bacterium]|jgi:hypothetical protein|nr:hypothetical protein [Acholeplasmataceae bacterium]
MKKWFLFLFIVICFTVSKSVVYADSNYKAFEDIELQSGKFLSEYSKSDYQTYYKKVNKRKFLGWRIYQVTDEAKVTYKTETLFSYYNDGYTPIEYNYEMKKKSTKSISLSATGSIDVKLSGTVEKFKGGLDQSLKITSAYKSESETQENIKLKISIDPGTMLNLYITGEGHISNGVAAHYIFWITHYKGGYEVFVVTTQYYRLEKVRV